VWDHGPRAVPGLGVRVSRRGAAWVVQSRIGCGRRAVAFKVTLGPVTAYDLEQARERAAEIIREARAGRDPRAERRAAQARTFDAIARDWIERDQADRRSRAEVWRVLQRDVLPYWTGRDIGSLTRADVAALLDRLVRRGAPVAANRLRAHLGRLFRWAQARGAIGASPVAGTEMPTVERARERVLSLAELRAVWRAADPGGGAFNVIVRILLLTGQRRTEIGGLRWSELHDLDDPAAARIELPGERTKNGRAHIVPLGPVAIGLIRARPRVVGLDPVFASRAGSSGFAGWSAGKARLEVALGPLPGGPWRLHDLRRSCATGLREHLGVAEDVVERLLNHVRPGVAGVYNRAALLSERRAALLAWQDLVLEIVA
jgi:integrase